MSSFTKATWEPTGRKDDGREIYRILGNPGPGFLFYIGYEGSTLYVHVPEGFLTDGPSIPSVVRWMVPKAAIRQAMKSAAVHDLLCEDPRFDRETADAIFLTAMDAEGTPAFWREVFFRTVRYNKSKAQRNDPGLILGTP